MLGWSPVLVGLETLYTTRPWFESCHLYNYQFLTFYFYKRHYFFPVYKCFLCFHQFCTLTRVPLFFSNSHDKSLTFPISFWSFPLANLPFSSVNHKYLETLENQWESSSNCYFLSQVLSTFKSYVELFSCTVSLSSIFPI